jgi:hypothetical protein
MEWYKPSNDYNIVRDFNMVQGTTHPTDTVVQPLRDINYRYVTIENSSVRAIGIAITTFYCGPMPKMQFVVGPGEVKNIQINSFGGPMQFIHLLDPITEEPIGAPTAFRTDANSFVLRDGINKVFVHFFRRPSYRAAK